MDDEWTILKSLGHLLPRWGGGEFALLLPHIQSLNDISAVTDKLIAALQPAFVVGGHSLHGT
ncbi:MAG: diguanylate cyclase [Synechococcales cyanobacterium C42_A2020_086]|nr:diguanylate cyclase [Synechococcales cyanobacterium C42_A2020_086]